jgi:hypothetical protein
MTTNDHCVESSRRTSPSIRALFAVGVAVAVLGAVTTGTAADGGSQGRGDRREDDEAEGRGTYAIGLWGDLPYSDLQAMVGVPNLIADMNSQELAFSVHDGDLKAGNGTPGSLTPTTCSDELYAQTLSFLNALEAAAIVAPGDNDWTDCDRPSNGGFSSLERLDREREVFFSTPFSLGQRRIRQQVQTAPLCPWRERSRAVRGEPALERAGRHVRDAQYRRFVQQPLRHCSRRGGVVREKSGEHRLDAGNVRGGRYAAFGRNHVHLAGKSRMGPLRPDTRPAAQPKDPRRDRRAAGRLSGVSDRAA